LAGHDTIFIISPNATVAKQLHDLFISHVADDNDVAD